MKTSVKKVWQLQEAKAKLSELARAALQSGPQTISIRGREELVLMSKKEHERRSERKPNIVDLFRNSPLYGLDLHIERDQSPGREIEL